jgi:hypothetical protein
MMDDVDSDYVDVSLDDDYDGDFCYDIDNIDFFQNHKVNLNDTEKSTIVKLNPGIYIVTINPLVDNNQNITFSISKKMTKDDAEIVVISNLMYQDESNISIELFWPDDNILFIKKNSKNCNGEYNVDFFINNTVLNSFYSIDLDPIDELLKDTTNKDLADDDLSDNDTNFDDFNLVDNFDYNENDIGNEKNEIPDHNWKQWFCNVVDFIFPILIVSYTIVQLSLLI